MQSCAFFWGKINMIRAYMGDSDLAIVLGERWLVVVVARSKKAGLQLASEKWQLDCRTPRGLAPD
jgi:hypothetical protein